jgi:general secretion pathway protein G
VRVVVAASGFSVVELAIVITVLVIILAITVPGFKAIMQQSREQALRQSLQTMRKAIDQYTADKRKAPGRLQDLVDEHYMSFIPEDPMTDSADTWEVTIEQGPSISLQGERGISDVHSGSDETGSDGRPYREW